MKGSIRLTQQLLHLMCAAVLMTVLYACGKSEETVEVPVTPEKPTPEVYRRSLEYLKEAGVFGAVSGVLAGKPMDETYAAEYKQLLKEVIGDPDLPVVFNVNIGHAMPRCIMPFGRDAEVNAEKQVIRFAE